MSDTDDLIELVATAERPDALVQHPENRVGETVAGSLW